MAKTSDLRGKKHTPPPPSARSLLAWYDTHGRDLPWRSHNGRAASPYHTWIAEIMLQQTTVVTVLPYYARFMRRWPSVKALAKADEEDVLSEWAGLGYYSRARNLLTCAGAVVREHKGVFPSEIDTLKKLPGIGDYTANAIRAIAFDLPANVVDGNVERVMARIHGVTEAINTPKMKAALREMAGKLAPETRPGDYAQALMDLGATVCKPRNPFCAQCPWRKNCAAFQNGLTDVIPKIVRKKNKPERHAAAFVLRDKQGRVFLRKRPATGLLANLWELPSTEWRDDKAWTKNEVAKQVPVTGKPELRGSVTHVFTHFKLFTDVYAFAKPFKASEAPKVGAWFEQDKLPAVATLTRKMLERALD